jgi:hypothetical protein
MPSPSTLALKTIDQHDAHFVAAALLTLTLEIAVVAGYLANLIGPVLAIAAHIAIVAGTIIYVQRATRRKVDASPSMLLAITTFAAGPLGALGSLISYWLTFEDQDDSDLLRAWYARLSLSTETDAMTQLSDTVAIGRSQLLDAALPSTFVGIFHNGSIADQQNVLGLIARHFHPDYIPALRAAVTSEATIIRVQAAAVTAHVRGSVVGLAQNAIVDIGRVDIGLDRRLAAARDLDACLVSGLLDERDRLKLVDQRRQSEFALQGAVDQLTKVYPSLEPDVLEQIEQRLLAAGRFAEFRQLRQRARRRLFGRYTVRRTPLTARVVQQNSPGPVAFHSVFRGNQ